MLKHNKKGGELGLDLTMREANYLEDGEEWNEDVSELIRVHWTEYLQPNIWEYEEHKQHSEEHTKSAWHYVENITRYHSIFKKIKIYSYFYYV